MRAASAVLRVCGLAPPPGWAKSPSHPAPIRGRTAESGSRSAGPDSKSSKGPFPWPRRPGARWHLPWRGPLALGPRARGPALRPGRAGAGPAGGWEGRRVRRAGHRVAGTNLKVSARHVDTEPAAPVRVGDSAPSARQKLNGAIRRDSHVRLEDPHESRRDEPWQELEGGRQHGGPSCRTVAASWPPARRIEIPIPLELVRRAAAKAGRHRRPKDTARLFST